jgi:hypothetical protein
MRGNVNVFQTMSHDVNPLQQSMETLQNEGQESEIGPLRMGTSGRG